MHHLKHFKRLVQPKTISSFNARSFSILGPSTFKVQSPYSLEVKISILNLNVRQFVNIHTKPKKK